MAKPELALIIAGFNSLDFPYTEDDMEDALATLRAALPPRCLILFALNLEALAKEKAHGGLDASFDMKDGRVKSSRFHRKTHWQELDTGKPRRT